MGYRVLVVDKKRFPREKTCGDGLTPRAVRQLHDMGLTDQLSEFQRFDGLRSIAHGITLAWEFSRAGTESLDSGPTVPDHQG